MEKLNKKIKNLMKKFQQLDTDDKNENNNLKYLVEEEVK